MMNIEIQILEILITKYLYFKTDIVVWILLEINVFIYVCICCSLLLRFTDDTFDPELSATIGLRFICLLHIC